MANVQYYDVILKPVITEKSMNAMAEKKYTFLVHPDANKTMIKEAVEKMFEGTKVAKVNTMNCEGKNKRRGMVTGKTAKTKKAIVQLTADSKDIESIDSDYEIIKKVSEKEKEVMQIKSEILILSDQIDEEYSFKLLDKQWILLGFAPIMKLFNRKLDSFATSKYNLEEEYRRKQEDEYNKEMTEKARNEIEKIAWNRHDINKMKYMLHTHRCTFCGTEAPEGSITFDFIKQRLADVMELLNPKSDSKRPEYKRLFKYRNIEELKEIGAAIKYTGKDIDGINDEIESKKEENAIIKGKIAKKSAEVDSLNESISLLYATSASGENLKDYVTHFNEINKWHDIKESASVKMNTLLTKTLPELKNQLDNKKSSQSKMAKSSGLGNLVETHEI